MKKYLNDLHKKTFGRLFVVSYFGSGRDGAVWTCKCACGNQKNVIGCNLTRGATKSCGCLAKELSSVRNSRPKDIAGKKFNKLTAIHFVKKVEGAYYWLFRCECGIEKVMRRSNVVARGTRTVSCGCHRKQLLSKNFMGKRNPRWNGGISPFLSQVRGMQIYNEWRKEVYKKDNYTCQGCKQRGGHNLEIDHQKPFAQILKENKVDSLEKAMACDELWNVGNGRVLCSECHSKTPTYKGRMYKILQQIV